MAVGTGIGVDLDALKNAIKAADKGLEDLISNSKKAKSSVIQTFLDISTQGVEPFLNKLGQQKEVFEALSKVSLKGASNELKSIVKETSSALDQTNKLITVYTELDKALAPIQEKRKATMESENDTKAFQKWLELKDKEAQKNDEIERNKFNKSIENIGKQSAAYQKAEDERYQKWLELKDKEKQREQADADAKWQRQKNTIYQQNAQFAAEELLQKKKNAEEERKIAELLSNERIEQVVKEARRRIENEKLIRAEQKKAHDQRQRELEDLFREQERQAKAQAKYDSKSRQEHYKSYITSYEGAIRTSDRANTLAKEIQAVKNLEAARAKLNKTDADYEAKLRDINNRIAEHNRNIDQATGRAKKLEQQHAKNAQQMTALKNLAGGVGRALLGMFSVQAVRGYVNQLIKVRGEFELQQKSLEVLLQNKDKADALWDKTVALAVKSPFRVKDLVTYTKQLAAYRVEADKLYDTNKMLADVSAGLGVDMGRLILAFGQVKAANFLRGTELRQFSEAGVNMLEELSKRYTELEGRMVSVGEVFDRVSKRMVSFSDVEAVFKTITSEGGTFYRMQEQQSNTLKGMVMNLKDSIDLMVNEIGVSNEGLLKGLVEKVKNLVDDWRKFVTILQEVGAAFVTLKLPSIVKSLGALGTTAYFSAINIQKNGLAAATFGTGIARLRIGIDALTTSLLKNPLFWKGAAAAALLVATHQFIRHRKEVSELNKKYDELSIRESNRLNTLTDMAKKAESYNKSIAANQETIKKGAKGTEEYANAERKLADARKSNELLMKQLKKDFPEIYSSIKANTDGTIDLNKAIEAQNKLLVANIALNEQAKGGVLYDDVSKNVKEATSALVKEKGGWVALEGAIKSANVKLIALKETGKITEDQFKHASAALEKISSTKDLKDLGTPLGTLTTELYKNRNAFNEIVKPIQDANNALVGFSLDSTKHWGNLQANLDRMSSSFLYIVNIAKQYNPETWQQEAARSINSSLDAFGIIDEDLLKRVREYIESMDGIGKLTWELPKPEYTEDDLKDWRKTLWNAIKKVNESLGDDLGQNKVVISLQDMIELDKESIFKNLSEQVKTSSKEVDETIKAGLIPTQIKFTEAQLNAAKASKPLIKSLSDLLAITEKTKKGDTEKILTKRMNLLKQMYEDYKKVKAKEGAIKAEEQIRKSYANAFKEAFENTGISLSGLKIDEALFNGVIEGAKQAGEKSGTAFTDGMLEKMKQVKDAGTYIRDYTKDLLEFTESWETFIEYAYYDHDKWINGRPPKASESKTKLGRLTVGTGITNYSGIDFKVTEETTLTEIENQELLAKIYENKKKDLNAILDLNKDLILTQEQYNALLDQFYQGEDGTKKAIQLAKSEWSAFETYLNTIKAYKQFNIKPLVVDIEAIKKEWEALDTINEKLALTMKWTNIITSQTKKIKGKDVKEYFISSSMQDRSIARSQMYSGDLEVVKLLKKAAIDVSNIDFTNITGLLQVFKQLKPLAEKEGHEAVVALEKEMGHLQTQIGFDIREGEDKRLEEKIQQLFDKYKLSIELRQLHLPDNLIRNFIGLDAMDLNTLTEKVKENYVEMATAIGDKDNIVAKEIEKGVEAINWDNIQKILSEDATKTLRAFLNDIDDLQEQQQLESAKRFAKFLTENLDKTKVVMSQEAIDISYAKKEFDEGRISAEQFAEVVKNIVAQSNEEISKFNLDKFKETSEYIQAMGDLTAYSISELEGLKKKLQELISANGEAFSAEEMLVYQRVLEKIGERIDLLDDNLWFKDSDIKTLQEIKRIEGEITDEKKNEADATANLIRLEAERTELVTKLSTLEKQRKDAIASGASTADIDKQILDTTSQIKGKNEEILQVQGTIKKSKTLLSELGEEMDRILGGQTKAMAKVEAGLNIFNKSLSLVMETYQDIKEVVDSFGVDTESLGWKQTENVMGMLQGFGSNAASAAGKFATGDIFGGIMDSLKAVKELIVGINKMHDEALEDTIQKHLEDVETLQKEYNKLEWVIGRALSFDKYGKVAEQTKNLGKQIENTSKAIALEEDKKDTDEERIKELRENAEDARRQIHELYDNLREEIVGSYEDLGSTLADAMIEALKNGEDALKAWGDSVDEIIADIVTKLAVQKYVEPQVSRVLDQFYNKVMPQNAAAEKAFMKLQSLTVGTKEYEDALAEWERLNSQAIGELPQLTESSVNALKESLSAIGVSFEPIAQQIAGIFGEQGGSGLSALQKGIQGITEDTAQIIESYLNSVRGYVSEQVTYTKKIYNLLYGATTNSGSIKVVM